MSDIVKRLRSPETAFSVNNSDALLIVREAADEIERLRAALETREAQVFERNAVILHIYNACDHYLRSGKNIEVEQ